MMTYGNKTRRSFIKNLIATILGAYTASTSSAQKNKISNRPIKAAKNFAFAHYMTGLCTRKRKQSVDDWKQDIEDAIEYEIDGWQFNFGFYEGMFKKNVSNFILALEQLNIGSNDFNFFPSFDCNHGKVPNVNHIIDWFATYYNHQNHFRLNGLPLLTVWQGRDVGNDYFIKIKEILANKGMPIAFIPYVASRPKYSVMLKLFKDWPVVDGFYTWVAGQTSKNVVLFNKIASSLCKSFDKTLMAGHGYSYLAINKRPVFVNKHAGEAITEQMMPLINGEFGDCNILNISTWNDYGEDHHISPHPPWGAVPVGSTHPVWCHIGYSVIVKYYLKWWKTGTPPIINSDTVAIFHLTQLAKDGTPPFPYKDYQPDKEDDTLYITSILKEPGVIVVKSGQNDPVVFHASSGVSHWRTSSNIGEQKYGLWRNGVQIFNKTSEVLIKPGNKSPWSWGRFTDVYTV
ncbi:MAG: glycoside hydrolase family 71 protein [Candidatus Thiodiazotropha lotti]|nr:glycoside hydrolase family 71 protein [Candidatus Thiodiazotropha lotti]MCW4219410.1 glycoside hydrolase family 71 protein [Candidatus Thiodiazotropha lotti]